MFFSVSLYDVNVITMLLEGIQITKKFEDISCDICRKT